MKHYILPLLCTACYTLGAQESQAPSVRRKDPLKSALTKGIRFESPDTSYSVKMGFRFQNLMALEANSDNLEVIDARILTRRARLKFDGYVFAPNVKYKVELGLSNSDMGSPVPQGNH